MIDSLVESQFINLHTPDTPDPSNPDTPDPSNPEATSLPSVRDWMTCRQGHALTARRIVYTFYDPLVRQDYL
jgi:hypothetical protein